MRRLTGRDIALRGVAAGVLLTAALGLAACDKGAIVLWPWVEADNSNASKDPSQQVGQPPGPPPPTTAVNPLDAGATPAPAAPADKPPEANANSGAPADGTPFGEKPVNDAVPISDSTPPVSADTGQPVTPLPTPVDAGTSGPNPDPSTATPPAATPAPATPTPATPPTPAPSTPAKPTPSFYYFRPGNLEPGSGVGSSEIKPLVPDMVFPIKDAPTHAQSQVYRYGGSVKGGDQCDTRNFSAPWRDNYCESRSDGSTTFCSVKGVHLGQDLRVGTPDGCKSEKAAKAADRSKYEIVAVEDGIVSNVGSYSISIRADSGGRIYRYLHLNMKKLKVAQGQAVKAGDIVGYVSNDFGGTPTTLHLHFEIKLNTAENGWQYAPPYASLLAAYQRREKNDGEMVADNFVVASAPGKPQ